MRRIIITAYESALTWGDIAALRWDQISGELIKISRSKTSQPQVVAISAALKAVLAECREEYNQMPNVGKLVFTNNGCQITYSNMNFHFAIVKQKAKIDNFHFHDLRHTCITRWASLGLPIEIAMLASGHKSTGLGIHGIYVNLSPEHVLEAFRKMWFEEARRKQLPGSLDDVIDHTGDP
jgi:integrase